MCVPGTLETVRERSELEGVPRGVGAWRLRRERAP